MRLRRILWSLSLAVAGLVTLFVAGLTFAPLMTLVLLEVLFPTQPHYEISRRFQGPDGLHKVILLRQTNTPFLFPGQGSDAPGHLCLVDAKGRILAGKPVEMVHLVEGIGWERGHARVRNIVDWDIAALQRSQQQTGPTAAALRRRRGTRNVTSGNTSLCRTELRP